MQIMAAESLFIKLFMNPRADPLHDLGIGQTIN